MTPPRTTSIPIQSSFIWLVFILFFLFSKVFFSYHHTFQLRSENVHQRYRLCTPVPVCRVKEIFCVQFYISTNPFVIFAHLFSNLCWSLVMINLRLPIAMCEKHSDNNSNHTSHIAHHIEQTERQTTIDTRNLENVHIIHNIFVWYLNKLFIANTWARVCVCERVVTCLICV